MKKKATSKVLSIVMSLIIMLGMIPVMNWSGVFIEANAVDTSLASMIARAEALVNFTWTPSQNIYTWNGNTYNGKNYFAKGETVKGVPYTLFTSEVVSWSLCSLSEYKSVASSNYSVTKYCSSVGATRTGPVYGSCCADLVCEVFGGSFMNGSTMRYHNVSAVQNSPYATTTYNVKASNIVAGDALSDTGKNHIIWVGEVTDSYFVIYEQTPPVAHKTTISKSSINSNGYLVYGGKIYSTVTKSKEFTGAGTISPPTNAWVSIPKGSESTYYVNEKFNITVGADNATVYDLYIYKDHEIYWSCSRKSSSGKLDVEVVFDKPGHYSCFAEAGNSSGKISSEWIGWDIVDKPSNAWVSIPNGPESSYKTNEIFTIEFGANNATEYYIYIYDSNGLYHTAHKSSSSGRAKINAEFYVPDHYSCYVEAIGPNGSSIISEWLGWDIVDNVPTDLAISVDRENKMYTIDEPVNFSLYANLGYYKHIGIHRVGGGLYAESDVAGNSFSINITKPGDYYANFDAFNACGSARSGMVYFTVVDSVPDYSEISIVGGNATEYNVGDTITFQMNTKNEHSKYIGIHKNSTFYTGGYIDKDTYSYTFTEAGSYLVNFDALNNYGYTRSNSVTFDVYEPYKVQYNASDATNVPSQQIKKHNTEICLAHEMPTKDGYIFKCWNTVADGSGVSYNPGDTYTENADLILYAVWESATLLLANTQLTVDRDNGIIYGTDLLGMSQGDLENQFSNDSLKIAMTDDSHIGTGTIIELVDSKGYVRDSITVVIFGDIDGNGWYDANDAFLVNMINTGLISVDDLGLAERIAADCNHDGIIDEADFELLVQAGILLDEVKQSAEKGDISTSSLYIDYCLAISQLPEVDTEADNSNVSDTTNFADVTYALDFIEFLRNIFGWLSKIFSFIVALF